MQKLPYKLISVFTDTLQNCRGNIAAVVQHHFDLSEEQMQRIALDLNQPATTFIQPQDQNYKIKWFAPDSEIPLCGHGAMAAAAYAKDKGTNDVTFHYSNGEIRIIEEDGLLGVMLPKGTYQSAAPPINLAEALGVPIKEYYSTSDKDIVVTTDEQTLQNMQPNFDALKKMQPFGYAVTAPSERVDFVSRTLVPKVQQLEDHATGSSHTVLVPFWSYILQKNKLKALQLSPRGGAFYCEAQQNSVILFGDYQIIGEGIVYL